GMQQLNDEVPSGSKFVQADHADLVAFLYFVIILLVDKGECQHTLFLQVGLVNTGERLHQDHLHIEMTRFHGSMLTTGSFAIILFSNHDGTYSFAFELAGQCRYRHIFQRFRVEYCIGLFIKTVYSPYEHVVGDVIEVTSIAEPGASHRDMVGGTLALNPDEQRQVGIILPVPGREGLQFLQTVRLWVDGYLHSSLRRGSQVTGILHLISQRGHLKTFRLG